MGWFNHCDSNGRMKMVSMKGEEFGFSISYRLTIFLTGRDKIKDVLGKIKCLNEIII